MTKNSRLSSDLEQYRALYEREKRKYDQASRDYEAEMEKRDRELEKHEQEIFDIEEHRQRLLVNVGNLESEVAHLNQQNHSLAEKLCHCQKQLLEERNKSFPNTAANETALFEAETKIDELKATISNMKTEVSRLLTINFDLDDRVKHLESELTQAATDQESLRSLIKCQQNDMENSREKIQELQIQIHQLNSQIAGDMPVAAKGNSLFAEVIDGKDRIERELALLHKKYNHLQKDFNRVSKIAYNNTMNYSISRDRLNLQGPTLAVFKMTSSELNMRLEEKLRLLDKIHTLEEADRKNLMKLAKENPSDFNIFQENLNNMVLREKQRLERRVVNMELRERELLDAISYEKARAASVPQLEHKLQQCERLLANYETAQLRLEDDGEDE